MVSGLTETSACSTDFFLFCMNLFNSNQINECIPSDIASVLFICGPKETAVNIEAKSVFGKIANYLGILDGCFSAESVVLHTLSSVSAMWTCPKAQLHHGQRASLRDR